MSSSERGITKQYIFQRKYQGNKLNMRHFFERLYLYLQ